MTDPRRDLIDSTIGAELRKLMFAHRAIDADGIEAIVNQIVDEWPSQVEIIGTGMDQRSIRAIVFSGIGVASPDSKPSVAYRCVDGDLLEPAPDIGEAERLGLLVVMTDRGTGEQRRIGPADGG